MILDMLPFRQLFVLGVASSLAACATTDRAIGLGSEIELTTLEALPPPRADIAYTIGRQTELQIVIVGADSLSGDYLTDVEGRLTFPLIGKVELDGRTPAQASQLIADRLRGQFVLDPQVRVIPKEFPDPSISVGGEVKKPGSYPAVGRQTLLTAINNAEGLTEYAKEDDVLVLRTVDGRRYIGVYNLMAIKRGNYPDPQLYPNDIVMVGDSPQRRLVDQLLQLLPPVITSAAILVSR